MFERLEILIGSINLEKIKSKKIAVVGLGGVGGYVVESLVRSGVENIILVDYDSVDITNKNRQIIALDSTIGIKKTEVFNNRIKEINKDCNVIRYDTFLDKNNIGLLNGCDYIIDACDSIDTKFEIIKFCKNNNIKFISCMGTGKRLNPNLFRITDLMKTSYDPLAKKLRKIVRENGIVGDIPVVCSLEQPIKCNTEKIGSNAFVPPTAGLLMTSYVINDIIK